MIKHEIIRCERCAVQIECRSNSYTRCQCSAVQLTPDEIEFIGENYDGCLCASCLLELAAVYQKTLA
ncbi:MAG: cysteine-rich CWC family protein [Arcticibacter sp.]